MRPSPPGKRAGAVRLADMAAFALRRLGQTLLVLLGAAIVVFGLVALIPGDPALILLGTHATPDALAAVREAFGLDRPVVVRFFYWLRQLAQGDLGYSYSTGEPVLRSIAQRLPATLQLALLSVGLATLVGVPAGLIGAIRRGKPADHLLTLVTVMGLSVPEFWLGVLLVMGFAVGLGWFPPSGFHGLVEGPLMALWYTALPAAAVAWRLAASIGRFVRASMLEVIRQQYVATARAKGVHPWVVLTKHALRNALVPVVTIIGLQFGTLLGGIVVVEEIFAWPGLGRLAVQAIGFRDYSLLQGVILTFAVLFSLINAGVDILYGALDPRIRYE